MMTSARDKLKAIRQVLGMSQAQFGEILGISGQQVSAIEKGRSEPSKTLLMLAVHRFDVDPKEFDLGTSTAKKSLEGRSRKAFSHLILAACAVTPVAPVLAGSVAAGVGVTTIILRMLDAYGAKTESQLARKLKVSRGVVWNWKKRGTVPQKYLLKASQETGKDVDWFISWGGEKSNLHLLEKTIVAFEHEVQRLDVVLSLHEKAKTISYLYGEFQDIGDVDNEVMSKVLKLVSS